MYIRNAAPGTSEVLASIEAFFDLLEAGDHTEAALAAGDAWSADRLREQLATIGTGPGRVTIDALPSLAQWGEIEARWKISDDGSCQVKVELGLVVDEEWTDHRAAFVGHSSADGFLLELESLE